MNEIDEFVKGIVSREGDTLKIDKRKLKEPIILLIFVGHKEQKIGDWRKWRWESSGIIHPEPNISEESFEYSLNTNEEIKGYLVVNVKGTILEKSFEPIIKQIRFSISILDSEGNVKHIEKHKIGNLVLTEDMIPLELKEFPFQEHKELEEFIIKNLTTKTKTENIVRIVEPYLSSELLDILDKSCNKNTAIHILTTTFGSTGKNRNLEKEIENKIRKLRETGRNIIIKQIREVGGAVNLRDRVSNPFHDRIIINESGGIVIGISLNGLYRNNTFVVVFNDGQKIRDKFDQWFNGEIIEYNNTRLQFIEWDV